MSVLFSCLEAGLLRWASRRLGNGTDARELAVWEWGNIIPLDMYVRDEVDVD